MARTNSENAVSKTYAAWARNDIDGVAAMLDSSYAVHSPFTGTIEGVEGCPGGNITKTHSRSCCCAK